MACEIKSPKVFQNKSTHCTNSLNLCSAHKKFQSVPNDPPLTTLKMILKTLKMLDIIGHLA